MKKMLFWAALSCVALASCESEDLTVVNQPQVMRFDAPAMKTRANVLGEISGVKYPEAEDFKVYCKAYKDSFVGWTNSEEVTNYFAAEGEVAKNGHSVGATKYWATDVVHYWPEVEYSLAFAAYSPAVFGPAAASATVSHTAAGLQINDFQTEANSNQQYDLMYSNRQYDLNKASNANQAVPLVFNHALSSIVFSSQKSSSDVNYVITDLEVNGLFCQKADFNQNITESVVGSTYTETEDALWENKVVAGSNVTYEPDFSEFSVPVDAPAQFTSGPSALLLIPQEVPAEATVTVYYKKITNPGSLSEKELSTSATIKLRDFTYLEGGITKQITEWEMGNRYIYRIAFGENTRIYFEPSVNDWVTHPTLIYTIK